MKCMNNSCDNELIGRQRSFCSDKCRKQASRTNAKNLSNYSETRANTIYGYIYLVHCSNTPYYKIGQSAKMPLDRLAALQIGCPYELQLVLSVYVPDYMSVERKMHEYHDAQHIRGEWFELDDVDLDTIKAYLRQEEYKTVAAGKE